jgi:uncharacterized repeat protein (TIGR03803 family)
MYVLPRLSHATARLSSDKKPTVGEKYMTKLLVLVVVIASTLSLSAQTFTTLIEFNGSNGAHPLGELTQGRDGNLYGVTPLGGGQGAGEVFRLTPSGTFTIIHKFNTADGKQPNPGLVLGPDGNFYGTTEYGANPNCGNGCGTIFRVSPTGQFSTLYQFTRGNDGGNAFSGLTMGRDGSFYGTTLDGGSGTWGTVYRWTNNGTLTTVHSFSGPDGELPLELAIGSDGNLYGLAQSDFVSNVGNVFRINRSGNFTKLHEFGDGFGGYPIGPLVLAQDTNLYGVTDTGTDIVSGALYKISPSGIYTFISELSQINPTAPTIGADGNFYVGLGGFLDTNGLLEQVTPAGVETPLHTFSPTDRQIGKLFLHSNGTLYGTTQLGGANSQ